MGVAIEFGPGLLSTRCAALFVVVALLCFGWSEARAEVPMLLNHQGFLADEDGIPLEGTFTISFAIHSSAGGTLRLPEQDPWNETHSVSVVGGVFQVLLGSAVPLPENLFDDSHADASGPQRFLQVTVDGEDLLPRLRLTSAAYAIRARTARFAESGPPGSPGPPMSSKGPTRFSRTNGTCVMRPAMIAAIRALAQRAQSREFLRR